MKKRLDALNRIVKLQARMHDLGRSRLTAIEQQQASLADDLRAISRCWNSATSPMDRRRS